MVQQSAPMPERAVTSVKVTRPSLPAVAVEELVGAEGAADEEVLPAVVVVVGEEGDRNAVEPGEARRRGDVLEGAVAPVVEEPRLDAVGDEEVVEAVVVEVGGGDAARAVADHAEGERPVEEAGVDPVREVDAGGVPHLGELRPVGDHPFALDELGAADLPPRGRGGEAQAQEAAVDPRRRGAARPADDLEADVRDRRLGRPAHQPLDVEADLIDAIELGEISLPLGDGRLPAGGAARGS